MRRGRRAGFTLIEIIVVLAVVLALLAILIPSIVGTVRDAGTSSVASAVTTISDAVSRFKGDVRRFPADLVWLTNPATGTPTDLCGVAIPAVLLARWTGPYLPTEVPTGGIRAGDATILTTLSRVPAVGTTGDLVITAVGVDQRSATDLEAEFDGNGNFGAGTIRWVGGGGSAVDTLRYFMPIRGC